MRTQPRPGGYLDAFVTLGACVAQTIRELNPALTEEEVAARAFEFTAAKLCAERPDIAVKVLAEYEAEFGVKP